ncbi:MAG TPA: hypothetical protein VK586_03660 [Streptosporangiaceae bacterium]|nr:hypothetical protein [Streptosporangiaceae bacterium]
MTCWIRRSTTRPAAPAGPREGTGNPGIEDLTWLAYRAAAALGDAFN